MVFYGSPEPYAAGLRRGGPRTGDLPIVLRKIDKNEKHLAARQRLLTLAQAPLHGHHIHPAAEFHADSAHGADIPEAE